MILSLLHIVNKNKQQKIQLSHFCYCHHGNDSPLSEMQEEREIQIMECDLSILRA